MRLGRRPALDVLVVGAAGAGLAVVALVHGDELTACAALSLGALTVAAARAPGPSPALAGQVLPLGLATVVLAVANTTTGAAAAVLAVVAYPFLGRAVLRVATSCRPAREADVVVEGALVGAASGILLQVAVADVWRDAADALPSVLLGLDVAVLVVGARALRAPSARTGPLAALLAGVAALGAAHSLQAVGAGGRLEDVASVLTAVALAAVGVAAVHPRAADEPDPVAEEPPAFARGHAAVVVVALLAAPAVLAVQAVRGVTAPTTVAVGTVVSGAILACYLVELLRERGTTEHRATHDWLTGLPNRTLFAARLDRAVTHARRNDHRAAVLFVDLDGFKDVNDTFGHAAGDLLLTSVAGRLEAWRRPDDTVARLAGDEFAVLVPDATGDDVAALAQQVLDALAQPISVAGQRVLLGGSVGVAVFPDDGETADELLASADAAMYRAKENGGSSYEVFTVSLATRAHERLRLEAALYDGMERDELLLHYQPIVDLPTGVTVGAEALVRWDHPEQGLLLPGHFVPVAERSDLVVLLGERVILDACRELRRWEDLGLRGRSISVNVSSRHFSHGLSSTIAAALRATGADPRCLVVELTESTAVDNLNAVAATLEELHQLGVRSAIDDFGTGYCGLRYLGTLPVDSLKIDRSFIAGMTASGAAIVAATIAMGHSLGMSLVAEGVETEEQRRFLEAHGCDRIQGFLVGRPMPAADLVDRLRAEQVANAGRLPGPPLTPVVPHLRVVQESPAEVAVTTP